MNAQPQPLVIEGMAMLAKTWGGHDVRSQPEEGDEGGDAGDLVPGRDLKFADLVLIDEHAKRLVGEYVVQAFFNGGAPDKPRERLFSTFSKIRLDETFKNCVVIVTFGVANDQVRLEPATIKNLWVKFSKTHALELTCTVVAARPRTLEVLDLESFGGKPVHVVLQFGPVVEQPSEQVQLPLQQPAAADKTRVLAPGQAEQEAETERQLGEALRGLESQQTAAA
jgi:hypothetical protein